MIVAGLVQPHPRAQKVRVEVLPPPQKPGRMTSRSCRRLDLLTDCRDEGSARQRISGARTTTRAW